MTMLKYRASSHPFFCVSIVIIVLELRKMFYKKQIDLCRLVLLLTDILFCHATARLELQKES